MSFCRYIYGSITQDQLAAFYRDAQVALVTPLRDGMNLVAKVGPLANLPICLANIN